jgi:DNA-damage-inducible protein J
LGVFPFDVVLNTPNAVTIDTMQEAECTVRDSNVKHYSDVEESLRELKNEVGIVLTS